MSESCCSVTKIDGSKQEARALKRVFWIVLSINACMFVVEMTAGILASSKALTADALDMLGDALVYGLSLLVVTKGVAAKATASLCKGIVMTLLAFGVLVGVVYSFFLPVVPVASAITSVGVLALLANITCLYFLTRHRHSDINVRSAWVCSRNDVVANTSVIAAGALVWITQSPWPDMAIGLAIALFVLVTSVGVIKDAWRERQKVGCACTSAHGCGCAS